MHHSLKALVLSVPLILSAPLMGGTIIVPVQDILMEIPNFGNAPNFNLMDGMYGGSPIGNAGQQERKTKREREQELIELIHDLYPDAISIRIWRGNVIIRLP
jgi:hypothetical protein